MTEDVIAEIRQGRLRGKKVTSAAGGEYYSFQGIPYAKPPIGPLRFKPPQKPEPWKDVWDATKEGSVSPSFNMLLGGYTGDEDCLFLNVYTPQWPVTHLMPVMFYIHGGGFMIGSGNTDFSGPDFLVAGDVVMVTINYRLGALGFLNLEGSDATTNNGLRDQVMALTWVKENIAQFGGDANNVTIFGISAGGISVHHLMLSPSAEGLFHRAIAMSGTSLLHLCFITHDVSNKRAHRLAKVLGSSSEDPQQMLDFLRTVPAEDIVKNHNNSLSDQEQLRVLNFPFSPTEEFGADRFLPDHPVTLMERGNFIKVPFITGVTSGEGKLIFYEGDREKAFEVIENLERALPWDLVSEIGTDRSRQIAEKLKNFYFKGATEKEDKLARYIDMLSDLIFVYPMFVTAKMHVSSSDSPVYAYMFDHLPPPEITLFPALFEDSIPGAPHGGDAMFLLYSSLKPNVFPPESPEATVSSHYVKLWTQFAKTGKFSNVEWPPVTKNLFPYLKIGQSLTVETDIYKERMKFMDELYSSFKRIMNKDF